MSLSLIAVFLRACEFHGWSFQCHWLDYGFLEMIFRKLGITFIMYLMLLAHKEDSLRFQLYSYIILKEV